MKKKTSQMKTVFFANNRDGELNASNMDNHQKRIRPSKLNEHRSPVQHVNNQEFRLHVPVNVIETGQTEEYHTQEP